jgi:hypothetical protein
VPDETFTFQMAPGAEERFSVWPSPGVDTLRGMFHCEVAWKEGEEEDETGAYVDLTILDGSAVVR